MFITFATARAPPVMGFAYDFLGEYTIAWIVLLILGLVIGACLIGATLLHQRKQKS
jgi:cyanate permease